MAAPVNPAGSGPDAAFTSGRPQQVDVRALEKELMRLWKSSMPADEAGSAQQPAARAALVTLVAVARGDPAAAELTALIARVTEHAPCRAILVNLVAEGRPEPLAAWASAHCHRMSGGRQVCCEQVTIVATPPGLPHVAGLVVPLLIPDLPVFLYWPGIPADDGPGERDLHERLTGHADYLIVDSARSADPARAVAFLAALAERQGPHEEPRDLNWSRLLPWREALADVFEPLEMRGWLKDLSDVEIQVAGGGTGPQSPTCPLRPLFFVSWLAGRLGWKRSGATRTPGGWDVAFSEGCSARIVLVGEEGPLGSLRRVTLAFSGDRTIRIERPGEDRFTATGHRAGREVMSKTLPRHVQSEDSLLCGEIDRRGADPLFLAALRESAAFVAAVPAAPGSGKP